MKSNYLRNFIDHEIFDFDDVTQENSPLIFAVNNWRVSRQENSPISVKPSRVGEFVVKKTLQLPLGVRPLRYGELAVKKTLQ